MLRRILEADGTEEEIDALYYRLQAVTGHPQLLDVIHSWDGVEPYEEVLERARSYKPFAL